MYELAEASNSSCYFSKLIQIDFVRFGPAAGSLDARVGTVATGVATMAPVVGTEPLSVWYFARCYAEILSWHCIRFAWQFVL